MEKYLYLETFGCQMNEHDSEKIAALLSRNDYRVTQNPRQADVILVNTCAIREKAEQKYLSLLGRYRELKETKPELLIGVGGCAAQQNGEALLRQMPQVDLVFGTHSMLKLPSLLDEAATRRGVVSLDFTTDLADRFDSTLIPLSRHPTRAYVTVMEGCDLFCTFCVVPLTRGREISRPPEQILDEARALAERGVKEITLLGQTVNAYGRRRGEMPFHELLAALDEVPGIARIRFTSSHPRYVTDGLIEAYRRLKHLCPHLHLPVQSGSDRVLERMHRRYSREEYAAIVARVREARPDIAITTDLLVGFPGESEEDFEATLALMREVRFSDAYTFAYSERGGTRAAEFADQLPEKIRKERLARLLALQKAIGFEENRSRVGCVEDVLVEGRSKTRPEKLAGRTGQNKIVTFAGDPALAGTLAPVRILQAFPNSLGGEAV
ncbi:MAG: tRNA (N6-isopentenyl adenosine(37)-C2)-methylthiotransferase MiaB [Deltaproteobacteria bacterium]|nr:tRNA (N6-isopentenyl adenosine(37)-C2)-methylthiotransferase MiaB [Deltaproteobacteria bacterium]